MNREMQNNGGQRRLTPEERALRIKKMKRGRRIRLAIVVVGFFLALCLIVSPIIFFTVFRVKNVEIDGSTLYTQEEIMAASGIENGENLFFADVDEAKTLIEKALPYTDNVSVKKKMPNTLVFHVETTAQAYAIEISEGTYALTNSEFKVLEVSGVIPENVVPIIGAKPVSCEIGETLSFAVQGENETVTEQENGEEGEAAGDPTLNLINTISYAINEYEIKDINLINISTNTNIYLIYQERIVLRLGDSSDIESKLSLAKRAVEDEQNADIITGTVNLTVSHTAYVHSADYRDIPELMEYDPEGYKTEEEAPEEGEDVTAEDGGESGDGEEETAGSEE